MATLTWPPELTLKSLMFTFLPRTLVPKNRGNLPRCPLWFFFPRWMVKFAHKDVEVQKDLNTWKKNKMVRRLAIPKSHWSNIERKSSTYLGQQHICSAFWNYEQKTWFLKRHLTNLPPTFNNFSFPASIFLVSKHFAKPFCLSTWASSCAKWWPLALLDIVNRQDNIPPTGKCREPCKYRDKIHVKRWVGFWSNSATLRSDDFDIEELREKMPPRHQHHHPYHSHQQDYEHHIEPWQTATSNCFFRRRIRRFSGICSYISIQVNSPIDSRSARLARDEKQCS